MTNPRHIVGHGWLPINRPDNANAAVREEESEVSEAAWFTLEEARLLPLAFTHNEILDAYAARRQEEGP